MSPLLGERVRVRANLRSYLIHDPLRPALACICSIDYKHKPLVLLGVVLNVSKLSHDLRCYRETFDR